MNKECAIVKDLLALYSEDMVSDETAEFIEEHISGCESCKSEYESMKEETGFDFKRDKAPLKDIKEKILRKRIAAAFLSVFLVLTILFTGYAALSTREYFEYSDDLITVYCQPEYKIARAPDGKKKEVGYYSYIITGDDSKLDKRVSGEGISGRALIVFDKKVTGCSYYFTPANDPTVSLANGAWICHVETWTSPWDKIVSSVKEKIGIQQSVQTLEVSGPSSYSIYYSSNNGQDEHRIIGFSDYKGLSLPRLVLNYYLIFAVGALVVSVTLLAIFRKKEKFRKVMTYISFVPFSYIISQLAVMGFNATTYSVLRDFKLILILTVFIFCVLISVYRIIQVRKEIKEINKLN